MAVSPPSVCSYGGCYRKAYGSSRCEMHPYEPRPRKKADRREYDRERGSASARGYDHAWHKVRKAFILRHPLCRMCEQVGRVRAAEEVDHIVPVSRAPDRRLDPTNLQSLCLPCHRLKTQRDKAGRYVFEKIRAARASGAVDNPRPRKSTGRRG